MKQDFDYSFKVHALAGDDLCECCEEQPARVRLIGGGAWYDACPTCAEKAKQKLEADYAETMRVLADGGPHDPEKEKPMKKRTDPRKCGMCRSSTNAPNGAKRHVVCGNPDSKQFCCIVSSDRRACHLYKRAEVPRGE